LHRLPSLARIVVGLLLTTALATAATATAAQAEEVAPANIESPVISGSYQLSEPLLCSPGVWSGTPPPSFTFQWLLNGTVIPGATSATYTPEPRVSEVSLAVECEVTASNSVGQRVARSSPFAIPYISCCDRPVHAAGPANTSSPSVSIVTVGSVGSGTTLACSLGTWTGDLPLSYSYQWSRDGRDITGATGQTFTVSAVKVPTRVSCTVTAANYVGYASARSPDFSVPFIALGPPYAGGSICGGPFVEIHSASAVQTALATGISCSARPHLSLVRKRGWLMFQFLALQAGTVQVAWYSPRHRAAAARKPESKLVRVASGEMHYPGFYAGHAANITAKLTSSGRALVRHETRLPLIVKARFIPEAGPRITVLKHVAVHR
jgi:hypothetical protein